MSETVYTLDAYVLDALMRDLVGHDRRASSFLVYLVLSAATEDVPVGLSYAQLAERTGLSKRSVQDAVRHLIGRGLLKASKKGATEVPRYEPLRPWRRAARGSAGVTS
jgi:hypothetical protein